MRVNQITVSKKKDRTTYSADFIFDRPFGGRKTKVTFWLHWLFFAISQPRQALKYGVTIRHRIWYTVPAHHSTLNTPNDAFFILALPLAIALQEDLHFEAPISRELRTKTKSIKNYYHEVVHRNIKVTVPITSSKKVKHTEVAQFFTLGVDSFFTLYFSHAKRKFQARQLIYVDGYDVPFYERRFLNQVHKNIKSVSDQNKTQHLFIETNLRQISDEILGWGRYHVSGLVAVAHLLKIKKIYISGESFEAADWGLRFGIDQLYTLPNVQVTFVAHNVSRDLKLKTLLSSPFSKVFLKHVRVCWENVRLKNIPYNCSNCQKCLKTQLNLLLYGVTHSPTFKPINANQIMTLHLVGHVYQEWQDLYIKLKRQSNFDQALLVAISKVLQKPLRK